MPWSPITFWAGRIRSSSAPTCGWTCFTANGTINRKAWFDAFTIFFLIFYLVVLLWGGLGSTAYSLGYFGKEPLQFFGELGGAFATGGPDAAAEKLGFLERSATSWRPYMWPIKSIMIFGFFLMLLQAISEFLKDVARLRGVAIR